MSKLNELDERIGALEKGGGGGNGSAFATTAWLETRIVVRPNPVKDRLVVESPVSVVATLLGSEGQFLFSRQLSRGEQSIDVGDLPAGNYLLVLQTEDGVSGTHKFVKE